MPKTLLAVDDSPTMRKVLEITFAGEDFRVITAESSSSALARMREEPVAAVIDVSLGGEDGYALAKEMRSRNARVALLVLSSRYSPYDANRGRDAGVDDYIDKPFDTQALIDKVKKALVAREAAAAKAAATAAPPPAPAPPLTSTHVSPPFRAPAPPPAPVGAAPTPVAATRPVFPTQRTHTLSFEGSHQARGAPVVQAPPHAPTPATTPTAAAPPPPAVAPTAPPSAHAVPTAPPRGPDAAQVAAATAANGQLASKLGELGLTRQQVDAVLALSREVVERVVWEVVPQLSEVLIKEEIARLMKER